MKETYDLLYLPSMKLDHCSMLVFIYSILSVHVADGVFIHSKDAFFLFSQLKWDFHTCTLQHWF